MKSSVRECLFKTSINHCTLPTGNEKSVVLQIDKVSEKCSQKQIQVLSDFILVVDVALRTIVGEGETRSHRVVDVEDGVVVGPGVFSNAQGQIGIDKVGSIFYEQAKQTRTSGATLKPKEHGRAFILKSFNTISKQNELD